MCIDLFIFRVVFSLVKLLITAATCLIKGDFAAVITPD